MRDRRSYAAAASGSAAAMDFDRATFLLHGEDREGGPNGCAPHHVRYAGLRLWCRNAGTRG